MTEKKYIALLLSALTGLAGCMTPLPESDFAFLVREAPLASCSELSEVHGITKRQEKPFTGRTVVYEVFGGFNLVLYQNGKRIPEKRLAPYWMPTWMPDQEQQPECYRAAFRAYARSDWGFAHDEYLRMIKYGYGEIEDVPKLIKGLEYYGDIKPGERVVCSWDHCLEALKLVTGANPGLNASDWKKWWEEYNANEKE
jgi:hypothetical protein